jgi:carbamoyltransferase
VIVCGAKLTHDGGVALIEDGRLAFSIEMEKLGNADRHSRIEDMSQIFDILRSYGYRPDAVDCFAIDGWRKTEKVKPWHGQEVRVQLAPYRRGHISNDPLQEYRYRIADFRYSSFAHYTGHVLGGYCTSPFARQGEDSYVLAWDGAMFPYLYFIQAGSAAVRSLGPVLYFMGDAYHTFSQRFPPFDQGEEFPATLALPGKIMAYVARGTVRPDVLERMREWYDEVVEQHVRPLAAQDDGVFTEPLGRRILSSYMDRVDATLAPPADMLATWHAFLQRLLLVSLERKLREHPWPPHNLVLVGGCALNIKWNRALREGGVAGCLWIPPFPNDAGVALGAACAAWAVRRGMTAIQWDVYSGPEFVHNTPVAGWSRRICSLRDLAGLLHEGNEPVVFLQGRAELGPRALGNRSLLASPRQASMKQHLNAIKAREPYRPIAPVCLEHHAPDLFAPGTPDPYMLFEHDVRPEWRSRIPAVCHEDGSARVQTVNREQNAVLFDLLVEFERISGLPVLCNSSANRKGKGFFPDLASATSWGRVRHVWSDGWLYESSAPAAVDGPADGV